MKIHIIFHFSSQELDEVHAKNFEDSETKKAFGRIRNISIVAEEEEEEESMSDVIDSEAMEKAGSDEADVVIRPMGSSLPKVLSRHSSTSSLADKTPCASASSVHTTIVDVAALTAELRLGRRNSLETETETEGNQTPAPFPVSSHIGTGGLSRQGSLRRSESSAVASPASERKSIPSSPSTPPGSNVSSTQGSPARYKMKANKKLVAQRSSPQLLNQIHEEEGEESGNVQKKESNVKESESVDPVDAFPGSAAGAAVLRRLEQRRRLHKSRTQSCSSSDASDDDSESRRKRHDKSRLVKTL